MVDALDAVAPLELLPDDLRRLDVDPLLAHQVLPVLQHRHRISIGVRRIEVVGRALVEHHPGLAHHPSSPNSLSSARIPQPPKPGRERKWVPPPISPNPYFINLRSPKTVLWPNGLLRGQPMKYGIFFFMPSAIQSEPLRQSDEIKIHYFIHLWKYKDGKLGFSMTHVIGFLWSIISINSSWHVAHLLIYPNIFSIFYFREKPSN